LALLLVGGFGLFTIITICLFVIFSISQGAPGALSFNALSSYFSWSMALLACTISVIAAYLFGAPPEQQPNQQPQQQP
jgi:hypothetical protein